jgi:hypothetical protein
MEMKTLKDLTTTVAGLRFLESEGVFTDQQDFKARLKKPVKPDLADELGTNKKLVCSGQQVYVDYQQSVLSKIELLQEMEQDENLFPFFLWVDTDRSGSDNLITKLAWPEASKKGPVTILPPRSREIEARFVCLDRSQLTSAADKLETHLRQAEEHVEGAKERYEQLRDIFTDRTPDALSQFNLRLTDFLLNNVFGYMPRSVMLSDLLRKEGFLEEIDLFVSHIADVVKLFNWGVERLAAQGIDPQVRPLPEHYLPLFFSCEVDDTRLRLHHHVDGEDHFAVTGCKCGQEYRFYLGRRELSVAEITRTDRWSPDVCFPIFVNDLVSGYVAGKSSAIYLMVMNQVLRYTLNKEAVPIMVPNGLAMTESNRAQFDSLIYRYLANGQAARHSGIFAPSR